LFHVGDTCDAAVRFGGKESDIVKFKQILVILVMLGLADLALFELLRAGDSTVLREVEVTWTEVKVK
jgi:hypothetical protein